MHKYNTTVNFQYIYHIASRAIDSSIENPGKSRNYRSNIKIKGHLALVKKYQSKIG